MKSRIIQLADYREAELPKEITIRCPEEYIRKKMKHLTRKKKVMEPVSVIGKGDIAVLSLECELSKFQKSNIPVTVGSGLFDAALEDLLPGHCVGEKFQAKIQGKEVLISVKSCTRICFPEPADEDVAAAEIEREDGTKIMTVSEYREYLTENYYAEQSQSLLFQTLDEVLDFVFTKSRWSYDEEELKEVKEEELEYYRQQLKEEAGKEWEELTDADSRRYFGTESKEELLAYIDEGAKHHIASALFLAAAHGKNPEELSLEEAGNESWEFMQSYVTEHITIKEEKNGNEICNR